MKPFRKILFLFLFALIFWRVERFCHKKTDGFQLVKIHSSLPSFSQWETPNYTPWEIKNLQEIFSQPFFFLDSGGQSYAFVSQDGKVVLKLFKMHHLRQYPFLYKLPLPDSLNLWRNHFLEFQRDKLQRVFSSCYIVYTQLQKETGLLYLNLNATPELKSVQLTLIDKIGIEHHICLQNIPFALQHKADNLFDQLDLHLLHHDIIGAKTIVKEIFDCLMARRHKNIRDLDSSLHRNIGLTKERAIFIDIGSFSLSKEGISFENYHQEFFQEIHRMHKRLKKLSTDLANYLDALIKEYPLEKELSIVNPLE